MASKVHSVSAGAGNWSASRPKPGISAVQPHPDWSKESSVTLTASPGSAPSMKMGPVTGLIFSKSKAVTLATVERAVNWPPEASAVSTSTVSPGDTVRAGGLVLFHPKWWWGP